MPNNPGSRDESGLERFAGQDETVPNSQRRIGPAMAQWFRRIGQFDLDSVECHGPVKPCPHVAVPSGQRCS